MLSESWAAGFAAIANRAKAIISSIRNSGSKNNDLQLHVFCDASTTAYAAVVYMRQETSEGTPHVKMLTAKTRVAPIKCICVPRMELCAALLGSKLVEATLAAISDKRFIIPTVFAWTDYQVTIAWLREFPEKFPRNSTSRKMKICADEKQPS